MDKTDYYRVLGLSRSATRDDIKKAHRNLALKYHPDKNKSNSAKEIFRSVQKAYEILIDDSKRREFDRSYREKAASIDPKKLYEEELSKIRNVNKRLLEEANAARQKRARGSSQRQSSSWQGDRNYFYGEILKDVPDDEFEKIVLDRLRSTR